MHHDDQDRFTSVRLTRKLAEVIDGVDLSRNQVGDRMRLPHRDARMLIAEGWAAPCEDREPVKTPARQVANAEAIVSTEHSSQGDRRRPGDAIS